MKKFILFYLMLNFLSFSSFSQVTDDENGEWSAQNVTLYNTPEAEMMIRAGDIDNLSFGWPVEFNPFSGNSTPSHSYPWAIDSLDVSGTDRIMVITSYEGSPPYGRDGYTSYTSRPENLPRPIALHYDLNNLNIESAMLQIFVDDFQASYWGADYFVTINGENTPFVSVVINQLLQTGPIGKIINVSIPENFLYLLESDSLSILFDDTTTGAGDGYAIDFVKLLINPSELAFTGKVYGLVIDAETTSPIEGAIVRASNSDEVITDENGYFIFDRLPAGINELWVTKFSYDTTSYLVDLVVGDSIVRDFTINEILEAEFSADITSASQAPLSVRFIDLSSMNPTTWSWDFGDGESSIEQNPIHIYTSNGSYTVTLSAENGEETNTKVKIAYIQIGVDGLEDINPISDIQVFPNPISSLASLTFYTRESGLIHVELIDFSGKSIRNVLSEYFSKGEHTINLNTTGIPDGIYFIRILNENNRSIQKVVILNN